MPFIIGIIQLLAGAGILLLTFGIAAHHLFFDKYGRGIAEQWVMLAILFIFAVLLLVGGYYLTFTL